MAVVLIVDDDPDLGDALAMALDDAGHQGLAACTADDALALASSEVPDLVLVDYNMPGVDTAALIRGLRGAAPAVRVHLCTGDDLAGDEVRRLGADDLLRKPFTIDAILVRLPEQSAEPAPA